MTFENSGFLFMAGMALFIYLVSKEWEQLDNMHLALRDKRRDTELDLINEEDAIIYHNAIVNKARAIVDYRNKYHISLSCAQEIIDSILKDATKAQS